MSKRTAFQGSIAGWDNVTILCSDTETTPEATRAKLAAQPIRIKPHYAKEWKPVTQRIIDSLTDDSGLGSHSIIKDYMNDQRYLLVMVKGSAKPSYIKEKWENAQPLSLRGIIVEDAEETMLGTVNVMHSASNDLLIENGKVQWMAFKLTDEMLMYCRMMNLREDGETTYFDKFSGIRYLTTY